MKPFYKSRTIILAAAALLFLLIDFFTNAGISEAANQALNSALIGDPEIKSVNFVALLTLIATIVMRIITKKGIETGNFDSDKKEVVKTFMEMPEAFKVPVITAMMERKQKEVNELLNRKNKKN